MAKYMITTVDNPFDPAEDFKRWWLFDVEHHYKTCEKLARLAQFRDDMSDEEVEAANEYAIDRMIELDFEKIYKKIEIKEDENEIIETEIAE